MRSREESNAYQRGYYAGQKGAWAPHKPPYPPEPVIRRLMEALRGLRDAADGICATIDPEDEFSRQLGPKICDADEALEAVSEWLAERDAKNANRTKTPSTDLADDAETPA